MHALSVLDQACADAALHASQSNADSAPLHIVLADLDVLLAHIDLLSAKLALAFRPAAPAYAASIPLLRELARHTSALAHATRLLHDHLHGATLTRNVRHVITGIIDALRALGHAFLHNAAPGEHILRIGTLHNLITVARCPAGISKDNQTAVHYCWKSDRDSLQDNLHELARIIEQAESQDSTPNDLVDDWDEIGLGNATNLDKDELARAKKVHQVLRLTTLLHKRILLDLIPYPSSAPFSAFDNLLLQSNLLLSTSDDLVAALYTPQDPELVRTEIQQLANVATSLQTQSAILLPLTDQLQALSFKDPTPGTTTTSPFSKRADKTWFDTCVDQIVRLCSSLTSQTETAT